MKLHEVTAPYRQNRKRVGRGLSAGQGKTAGRGTKGQRARTGFNLPHRFEGGQSSLIQRLPKKRGFRSFATKPTTVRIDRVIERLAGKKVTVAALLKASLINAAEAHMGKIKLVGAVTAKTTIKLGKGITTTKALADKLELAH